MSDPDQNDNGNPDVDNLASLTTESHTIVCEAELDDDFFVCRKCNKVFKDLSEYLEHKIRDENYKLSHTRSKVNKKMVIPQLVEKKKSGPKKVESTTGVEQPLNSNNVIGAEELTDVKSESGANKDGEDGKLGEGTVVKDATPLKRGRKRKSETLVPEQHVLSLEKENNCNLCDKKFRRAATLRWHLKYDHEEKEDNSEESDTSVDAMVAAEIDEDFDPKSALENEEPRDIECDLDGAVTQQRKITVLSAVGSKEEDGNVKEGDGSDYRPYVCDICGRGFKELPVYKAHAVVHSKERNYVCTVEGCPYGFKTKGCLVRHMRRHTGERPYACEKCGRSFAESGALNRHMKARRNCAQTPDTHYPRYKKKWSYHPNIEAVVDEEKRDLNIADQEPMSTKYFIHRESIQLAEGGIEPGEIKMETVNLETESEKIVTPQLVGLQWSLSDNPANAAMSLESSVTTSSGMPEQKVNTMDVRTDNYCQVCNKEFQQLEHLEAHLRTHLADQPNHCGLCHFFAQNRDEMRQHVLTMHTESLNDIESTMVSLEPDPAKNAAQQKDERTALREALQAIKQLHRLKTSTSNKKPSQSAPPSSTTGSLQCMICNKTFKGVNYMRQHMRMHTGDRPYKCQQCNRSFTSKDVMKKHMWVHMNQRDYKCGECGKMFKRLVHVQQHIKTHSQERLFRCSICEKLFKTHNSLKVHLRTHTNINPYRCHVCNRHFRERGSLQRHMRLHTGERPFVCPHCNRGFAEQGTLSRHLRAKVPCSATRDSNLQLGSPNNTVLAQFSSVVADSQYILPSVNNEDLTSGNLIVLKTGSGESEEVIENIEVVTEEAALDNGLKTETLIGNETIDQMMEESNTETIQVYDTSTGESFVITGEKSVIKSQQMALETMNLNGELSLDKIREIFMTADREGQGEQAVAVASTDNLIIGEEEVTTVMGEEGSDNTADSIIISSEDMAKLEEGQEISIVADGDRLEIDVTEQLNQGNVHVLDVNGQQISHDGNILLTDSSGQASQGNVHIIDESITLEMGENVQATQSGNVHLTDSSGQVTQSENVHVTDSSGQVTQSGNVHLTDSSGQVTQSENVHVTDSSGQVTQSENVHVTDSSGQVTQSGNVHVVTTDFHGQQVSQEAKVHVTDMDGQIDQRGLSPATNLGVGTEVITVLTSQVSASTAEL